MLRMGCLVQTSKSPEQVLRDKCANVIIIRYGANLNFDLCIDSGASSALFGSSGVGLGGEFSTTVSHIDSADDVGFIVGTAQQVSCSQWSGTVTH